MLYGPCVFKMPIFKPESAFFYKFMQLLAFIDNMDILVISEREIYTQTFRGIRNSAEKICLKIDEYKTKYVIVDKK